MTKRRKRHASDDVRNCSFSQKLREGDAINTGHPGAGKFHHWRSVVWADDDKSELLGSLYDDLFHVSGVTATFGFHVTV